MNLCPRAIELSNVLCFARLARFEAISSDRFFGVSFMKVAVTTKDLLTLPVEAVTVGVFVDAQGRPAPTESARLVDAATDGAVMRCIEGGDFKPEPGSCAVVYPKEGLKATRIVIVGLGRQEALTEKRFIQAVEAAVHATKAESLVLTSLEWVPVGRNAEWALRTGVRAAFVASRPRVTMKTRGAPEAGLQRLFVKTDRAVRGQKTIAERGRAVGNAMVWAKHVADLAPNVCTPEFLADAAQSIAQEFPDTVACTVLDEKQIDKLGMGGLMAVSRGSAMPPRFIELSYRGADEACAPVVLVGKGITFDAGGISLKPARGMEEMKYDMCGASVVLAVLKAAAEMQLKQNVVALVPTCENLPSGTAVKPADIIMMMNGLSVEVLNTDAEGRLILADALTYAERFKPAVTIDVATLTGACIVALGNQVSGLFCEDEGLTDALAQAADSACDAVWPMPMGGTYADQLKSVAADLANIGSPNNAGASTAASFLASFAPKSPWAHLDVAGTASVSGAKRASTARPVPLLTEFLLDRERAYKTRG